MKIIKNLYNKKIGCISIFFAKKKRKEIKKEIKKVEVEFYKNLNIKIDLFKKTELNSLNEDQKRFLIYLLNKQKKELKRKDLIKFIMCAVTPWVSFFIMLNATENPYMLYIHFTVVFIVILINFIG